MKKTRLLLLAGITCVLVSALPIISYCGGGGPGGKKSPAPAPNCTINTKSITLNLSFAVGFVNGCIAPEGFFSDYRQVPGATTLTDNSKYFCKITVTPNMPSGCSASPTVSYWTAAGSSKSITIPSNRQSRLTVEYYERCSTPCGSGNIRRYFKYETTLFGTESFVNTPLEYVTNKGC